MAFHSLITYLRFSDNLRERKIIKKRNCFTDLSRKTVFFIVRMQRLRATLYVIYFIFHECSKKLFAKAFFLESLASFYECYRFPEKVDASFNLFNARDEITCPPKISPDN